MICASAWSDMPACCVEDCKGLRLQAVRKISLPPWLYLVMQGGGHKSQKRKRLPTDEPRPAKVGVTNRVKECVQDLFRPM